ncbi:MAG: hypothetical protein FIB03_07555 [Anaerolineae bacterium]|nr:hypothetical protein [Anaerolineae bacterium]
MKYKIKAKIPRVLFLCCSDNIIQPNNANGIAGTPYNNIVPENRLSASYDAIKPGNNNTHLNHSDSIVKDTRTRDEYKSIPISAPANHLGKSSNLEAEETVILCTLNMPKL